MAAETSGGGPSAASGLPDTPPAWDAYVRAHPKATYLQTSAWAQHKLGTGWRAQLVVAGTEAHGIVGAQVLLTDVPILPWRFAYAPRGPLADAWTVPHLAAWSRRLRDAARGRELAGAALLRMDPEVEEGSPLADAGGGSVPIEDALARLGWRRAPDVQPRNTRVIDLAADEAALWSDLRKKWRQYVNKARSNRVTVRDVDATTEPSAFATFHRVMRETSGRTGVPIRTEAVYRELWATFRPTGESRLLFAEGGEGEVLAVLLLVSCGGRVVEPYGGMTAVGAERRANYLLKWEAIRTSRERGARSYDLWGLVHPGISHFKEGFGGRAVRYAGDWDLDLSAVGGPLFRLAERGRRATRRAVRAVRGRAVGAATETPDA